MDHQPSFERQLETDLAQADPDLDLILGLEAERQASKLIMIASESICPLPVRQALGSVLTSVYAEGYPSRRLLAADEAEISDVTRHLAYHRRYGDRRYYKGTEYANLVEALAQRRVASLFATTSASTPADRVAPGEIFANVQALSGAAANNAVYSALLEPGDSIMGMNLTNGGHLTHGSPVNRSGRMYRVFAYGVDSETGRIDYEALAATARQARPKLIVAGGSAFPWEIDWHRLREIADDLPEPALLLADISHPAGLVVAGLFPNPIGIADVITFTTHKTMIGPRAAVILSTDRAIASKIDRAVFPGEQGGPHLNNIAAMAVAFHLASQPAFRRLQRDTVANAQTLATGLVRRGLKLAYGGTSTHLLLIDLRAITMASGVPLNGDLASRILDTVGLVCNKNTIAGDTSAVYPSGLRLGTTWLTQRGFGTDEMDRVAGIIHDVLTSIETFEYPGTRGPLPRGKAFAAVLKKARSDIADLAGRSTSGRAISPPTEHSSDLALVRVSGTRAAAFLQEVLAGDVLALAAGQACPALALTPAGEPIARVAVLHLASRAAEERSERFALGIPVEKAAALTGWLAALSDGYVRFDPLDVLAKIDGPVSIGPASYLSPKDVDGLRAALADPSAGVAPAKPYFVGQAGLPVAITAPRARFEYKPAADLLRHTALHDEHRRLGARLVPFAGWEMPVWYTSIGDEHRQVRSDAGLFDLAHMGVLEVSGPGAGRFLDLVTTNSVVALDAGGYPNRDGLVSGRAQYSYLLGVEGEVLDDVLVYRRAARPDERERYMVVANAANAEKIRAWLDAVNAGSVAIDLARPDRVVDAHPTIRDLRTPAAGAEARVDLAVQGPRSREALLSAVEQPALRRAIERLAKFEFVEGEIQAGLPAIISRTGYTGEGIGFEICVRPDQAVDFWRLLLSRGEPLGLRPIGLGARDSLRTEAGFPLYGHELAGDRAISPFGAGYGSFVKPHKPFFVGRGPALATEGGRASVVARFRMNERGGRVCRPGDPVVDRRGEVVGSVTSCTSIDGVQFGMAYLARSAAEPGAPIGIFPVGGASRARPEKPKNELALGDRVTVHEAATVVSRFR